MNGWNSWTYPNLIDYGHLIDKRIKSLVVNCEGPKGTYKTNERLRSFIVNVLKEREEVGNHSKTRMWKSRLPKGNVPTIFVHRWTSWKRKCDGNEPRVERVTESSSRRRGRKYFVKEKNRRSCRVKGSKGGKRDRWRIGGNDLRGFTITWVAESGTG